MTYLPEQFEQQDPAEITAFLDAHPFATLVVMLNGELWPTPLPLMYQPSEEGHGTFIGHVALANDMWRAEADQRVLVIVNGPDTYITPNWYATKAETHEVVPTWNYVAVHAWGTMSVHHESKWKRMAVGKLTKIHEATNEIPWRMGDAPQEFIAEQLEYIVGIEIEIDSIVAKYKLNQNRSAADRTGVITGLEDRNAGSDASIRDLMNKSLEIG